MKYVNLKKSREVGIYHHLYDIQQWFSIFLDSEPLYILNKIAENSKELLFMLVLSIDIYYIQK